MDPGNGTVDWPTPLFVPHVLSGWISRCTPVGSAARPRTRDHHCERLVHVSRFALVGTDAADFTTDVELQRSARCSRHSDTCTATVTFTPRASGPRSTELSAHSCVQRRRRVLSLLDHRHRALATRSRSRSSSTTTPCSTTTSSRGSPPSRPTSTPATRRRAGRAPATRSASTRSAQAGDVAGVSLLPAAALRRFAFLRTRHGRVQSRPARRIPPSCSRIRLFMHVFLPDRGRLPGRHHADLSRVQQPRRCESSLHDRSRRARPDGGARLARRRRRTGSRGDVRACDAHAPVARDPEPQARMNSARAPSQRARCASAASGCVASSHSAASRAGSISVRVALEVGEAQQRHADLARAEELAGTADQQVLARDLEAVGVLVDHLEPRLATSPTAAPRTAGRRCSPRRRGRRGRAAGAAARGRSARRARSP